VNDAILRGFSPPHIAHRGRQTGAVQMKGDEKEEFIIGKLVDKYYSKSLSGFRKSFRFNNNALTNSIGEAC
jgi:hypothetical protein